MIATTPDGTELTDQASTFIIDILDPCEPPTVVLTPPSIADLTYYLQDPTVSIIMDAFTVTNKPQSYCLFDHIVDIPGALAGAMASSRGEALVNTGQTFTLASTANSLVGSHTVSIAAQSAKGLTIPDAVASFTVTVIDPCEGSELTATVDQVPAIEYTVGG